jgi:hypothetical protein
MAGPIIVEGPDGQEYEFPAGTSPDVMKQAMRKRYAAPPAPAAPAQPASPFLQKGMGMLPQGTQPVFPAGAMATPPRQPAAWEAGARDYLANMPERERGGIESGADAFLFNVGNVLTGGGMQRAGNQVVPGKNLGDAAVTEGESYYPTASVVGRGVGYAVPAGQGGRVANMATQDLITASGARALAPKALSEGTGALARGTRYLGRLGTLAPVGALQVGAYEGLVEQPVRDFMAGEESTIGGRVRAGANALANPLNYGVLPAASLVGRVGKSILTGVATPGDVQRAVSAGSRGAVPLSEGQLAADAAQILDTQAMNAIDPRGFKLVERILRQSGVADSDVPAVNAKVREILKAAPDAVAGRLTVGQVYAKALYDLDKTQASENILKVLRERRNVTDVGDRSPSIVGKEVRDLRSSQVDFVTQSAESNLGAGKRIDIKNAVADTKKQIGAEYNRVLAEADPTRPEAPELSALVIGDASKGALVRRAKNAGFKTPDGKGDVDAYAMARPDEAAHWLRSHLDKAAQSAQGRERVDLQNTVDQLDDLLDTNPGYANARKQYGTEGGVDKARKIGANFIAAARNQGNLDELLEQIGDLPARERDVALLAIRDNLLSPVRGSGEEAPAKISQLVSVGTLEGLERLGPAGKGLADDIRAIRDENNFLGQIDSGNPLRQSASFSNADAADNAPGLYSGAVARTLNDRGGSSLAADIAVSAIAPGMPIAPFTMAKIARGGLQAVFAPSRKSKEAMTQFLMSRPRNAPGGPKPGGPGLPKPGEPDIMPSAGIATAADRAQETPNALSGATMSGQRGGKPAPAPRDQDTIAREIEDIERQLKKKGYTLNEAETLAEEGTLPEEIRGLMIVHDDLVRESGRMQGAGARAKGGAGNDPEYLRAESEMNKASDEVANAEAEIARDLREQGLNWDGEDGDFMGVIDTLQREGRLSNYLTSRVADLRAASTRMLDAEAKMKARVQSFAPAESYPTSAPARDAAPGFRSLDPAEKAKFRPQGFGGGDAANALAGAGLGGIAPADSAEERARNMAVGAGIGLGARRFGKAAGSVEDGARRTVGSPRVASAGVPKTPAQAVKFETPGSPEYEAAKAKGLDMSREGTKARAREQGYNTDQVWYHGTRKDFDAFDTSKSTDGLGIHVGTVDQAEGFARSTKALSMKNQDEFKSNRQILPLYVRANNSIRLPDMQDWEPNRVVRALRRKGIEVQGSGYQGGVTAKDIVSALKREGYDSIVYANKFEADASGKDSLIIFDPSNIRSVNAAFDPDKAASPILTAGAGGGRKPPKPDSPEAIRNALKGIAKPKPAPTRLEQMVEEGKNADVPPIRGMPDQDVALTEQALRMEERGLSPIEIYDQTGVAMVPYNGAQVPIISPKMGPEELTRQFYTALALPASKRPDWVKEILARAPRKKGLMLRDKASAPQQPNALAEPPLPSPGTPYGAIGIGAGIGAATGIPAGAVIGTMMAREQDRKVGRPRKDEKRTVARR